MTTQIGSLPLLDWAIVAGYLAVVISIGLIASRKAAASDEFFLAGRSMPMWAVALSLLATTQSAATFVGGPARAYRSDLTYLSANIAGLLAVVIVALVFVPAFYKRRVTSVYELLRHDFGSTAQRAASGMFMLGRVFASGARLFIVAIPFALIAFGEVKPATLIMAILIIAAGATLYTITGGIRAVIWTDVLQSIIYVGSVLVAVVVLWRMIDLDITQVMNVLRSNDQQNKLQFLDWSSGISMNPDQPASVYSIWPILFGLTLFNIAAYGTDQDLAQRLLTCKDSRRGAWSVILSQLIGWPVVLVFLSLGLLLYVFHHTSGHGAADDPRQVFVEFIVTHMPMGVRGLMLAGLFAAAMSSLDSALNAMASTTIADFYRPWKQRHKQNDLLSESHERRASRLMVFIWACVLAGFAIFCVYWQKESGRPLVDFALNVMVFAYSGLLAVFLTALFTNRGNAISVIAALITGFAVVFLMQPEIRAHWLPEPSQNFTIAFGWTMLLATTLSFTVCCLGRRSQKYRSMR